MLTKLVFFSGGRPVVFLPEASAGLAWRGYRFNNKAVVVGTVPAVVPSASNFLDKKTNKHSRKTLVLPNEVGRWRWRRN